MTADIGVKAKAQAELRIIRCTRGDAVQVSPGGFRCHGVLIMEGVHGDGLGVPEAMARTSADVDRRRQT